MILLLCGELCAGLAAVRTVLQSCAVLLSCAGASAMPFISHQFLCFLVCLINWLVTYFMSGVRPIELIVRFVLCEQAHTYKPYNQFCMAELFE